jgi:predicted alpha/beta hydrolase
MVVLASATGVPQQFYARFATYLAEQSISVVTFDYRGIGESRRTSLRGFDATFVDGATFDLAAVVDWALARAPTTVVAHSFGGHAFGLLPRANETNGLYAFGAGSGWHGHMPRSEALKVQALWHAVAPLATRITGCLPMKKLGMGEDLPLGVYHQWKRWCGYPRYFLDDPSVRDDFSQRYASVTVPTVFANTTDDLWASPAAARALFEGLQRSHPQFNVIDPKQRKLGSIGHMGYFRAHAEPLWQDVATFVTDRSYASSVTSHVG